MLLLLLPNIFVASFFVGLSAVFCDFIFRLKDDLNYCLIVVVAAALDKLENENVVVCFIDD